MTETETIRWLHDNGYFWSPECLKFDLVDGVELDKLSLNHPLCEAAIYSLQFYDSNFQTAIAAAYGYERIGKADGVPGDGTFSLMDPEKFPRCGCPMFPDPSRPAMAIDRGSWDTDCVPGYEGLHATIVAWDVSQAKSPVKENFDAIWKLVVDAQRQVGQILIRDDNHRRPHIRASFSRDMPSGAVGYATVLDNPSCGSQGWARVHPDYVPANWKDTIPQVIAHEVCGHVNGQNHVPGSNIINSSVRNVPFRGWVDGDPGKPQQLRWFGGPIEDDPGGGDDPPTGDVPKVGERLSSTFSMSVGSATVWAAIRREPDRPV